MLHGYGQLARFFIRHFQSIDDGTRFIVAPEGLSRFYLPGHQRVGATWMTKEDRLHEIDDYLAYLDAVAVCVLRALPDDASVTLLGFSQGATTACRWTTMGEIEADRLILWAGGLPHDLDFDTHAPALRRLGLTLVLGTDDEYITTEHIAEQQAILDRHAIPHRFIRFDGDHRLHAETLQALAAAPLT